MLATLHVSIDVLYTRTYTSVHRCNMCYILRSIICIINNAGALAEVRTLYLAFMCIAVSA